MGIEFGNPVRDVEYYLGRTSLIQPTFQGETAKLLGIHNQWDEEEFRRLWKGHHPDHDKMLPGMRNVANRIGAIDITFNHDKGSSLVRLIGGDERLEDVALKARRKAMKLVEKKVTVKIRKQSQLLESKKKHPKGWRYPERKTANILFVEWGHPDNRESHPHWHHHVTVLNLTADHAEEQFKTINTFNFTEKDKAEISDVYHKKYVKGARKLGHDAHWDGKTLELRGVDKGLCEFFSTGQKRAKKTEARYADKPLSKRGKQKVQLFDRPERTPDIPLPERQKGWIGQMTSEQFAGLKGFVAKARAKVSSRNLSAAIDRWQEGLKQHASKLRAAVVVPDDRELNRERNNGISR